MYGRGRSAQSAKNSIGPMPYAPNYRDWWTKAAQDSRDLLAQAEETGDSRLASVARKHLREAEKNLR